MQELVGLSRNIKYYTYITQTYTFYMYNIPTVIYKYYTKIYLCLFIPGMNIRPINIEFNKHGYFVHHSCIRCKVGQRFLFSFPGIKVCRFAANVECDSTWKRMGFVKYIYIQSGRMRNYFNKKIIFFPQFILFKFFSSNKKNPERIIWK